MSTNTYNKCISNQFIKMKPLGFLFFFLGCLSLAACERGPSLTQSCEIPMQDQVPNIATPEAIEIFELAKAYDSDIYRTNQLPEPGPPVLEKYQHIESDRVKARELYEQAAKLGHVISMNRLAMFQAEGLGLTGDYDIPDFKASFYWFKESARRGDSYGFNALADFFLYGLGRKQDPAMGEKCLIQAAKRGMMEAQIRLAELDLGLLSGYERAPVNPPHRIERGLQLLEDAGFKGYTNAYRQLKNYYYYEEDIPIRAEYYARFGSIIGNERTQSALESGYRNNLFTPENQHLHTCVNDLKPEDFPRLEELCPRVGGPLTRERVGLPPAPTEPLDVEEYLDDFERKYGEPK